MNELRNEWGTHVHASEAEWDYPITYGEAMQLLHVSSYAAVHQDPKQPKATIPTPWGGVGQKFTAEEIDAAEAVLKARSAIRD